MVVLFCKIVCLKVLIFVIILLLIMKVVLSFFHLINTLV